MRPFGIYDQTEMSQILLNYNTQTENKAFKSMVDLYQKYHSQKSPNSKLLTMVKFNSVHEYLSDLENISRTIAQSNQ